ncbi:BadF/BadG/BcrA/BcrD ATPase family protein [Mariniplasma anaerobium]|uniref:ATPase n=1 Tax=Mariniplasma anaerobium TaxID=2735436 RepID=A0A7U9THW3_9MOLU|nr:BadF/BadG/BcrA/BcrD ATPase family protein [Mariniplasma anaerobium]BCR36816.1 ATPase [Mariniplasma anaerobium]
MSKYIIGIDGGGTKTLGVLYDIKGNELKRSTSGFTNFNIDLNKAKENMLDVLDKLTIEIKPSDELFIQMGISGYSKIKDKIAYEDEIGNRYHATASLESDVLIALYDVKKDQEVNVIMVIGGTGSVLMYSDQYRLEQVGGFGHLLGDEGSAYHLSISALKMIISTYEDTNTYDEFSTKILNHLNIHDQFDVRDYVYNNDKTTIANLAKFISQIAIDGNEKAKDLINDEAKHLARQTIKAYLKLQEKDKVIIALRGGFLTNAPFVKQTLIKELEMSIKDFEINEGTDSPVKGAYYLSLLKLSKG